MKIDNDRWRLEDGRKETAAQVISFWKYTRAYFDIALPLLY
ncbi:hypothetical protein [Parageobacillus thermantarcticus]|nr:hypothetical protein [Parageobacillus thermantarcticus]